MNPLRITTLNAAHVAQSMASYATRRVPVAAFATLLAGGVVPRVGDLVLARVDRLGRHRHLELANGPWPCTCIAPGDELVLAYGHRNAPGQFEAAVPDDPGSCHLVAEGGVAARVANDHGGRDGETAITPLGLLGDRDGRPLNLADFALAPRVPEGRRIFTAAVVGTSTDAGRTETAANLIRGLTNTGVRVGAARITGAAAGSAVRAMAEAGAEIVLDLTDAGLPTTCLAEPAKVEQLMNTLLAYLGASGVEAVVLELAGGLAHRETAELLHSPVFARAVDALVFAGGDARGSVAGVYWLRDDGRPHIGSAGLLAASPPSPRRIERGVAAAEGEPDLPGRPLAASRIGCRARFGARAGGRAR
jgi:hypothetical protein